MRRWILSFAVSVVLLAWVFRNTSPGEVLAAFSSLHVPHLVTGVLLYLAGLLLRSLRYRVLLNRPVGLWSLVQVTQVRNMLADLLPARIGTVSYVYLLVRRFGADLGDALSSFVSVFFLDIAAIAPLFGLAFLSLMRDSSAEGTWGFLLPSILLLCLTAAALALLPLGLKLLERLAAASDGKWGARFARGLRNVRDEYGVLRRRGALWPAFGLSLGVRLAKYGSWYFLLLAVIAPMPDAPSSLPFSRALVGVLGAELSSALPVGGLAGFGTYEAAWAIGFGAVGFSRSLAAISGITTHLISQIIDYSLGVAALLLLYRPAAFRQRAVKIATAAGLAALLLSPVAAPTLWSRWFPPEPGIGAAGDGETEAFSRAGALIGRPARLVWSSNRSGNHEIHSLSLPEGRLEKLTDDGAVDFYSRFSPDGRKLLFLRSREEWVSFRDDGRWDVWLSDRDGGNPSRIAEKAYHPSWWPDGRSVVYHRGRLLYRLHLDGPVEEPLGRGGTLPQEGRIETPDVSPDGSTVALTIRGRWRGVGLWTVGSGVFRKVGGADGCQICWGPGGRELYWVSSGGRMKNRILRAPAGGGEPSLLLDLPGEYSHEYFPRLSNDGRFLVFAASAGGHEHDRADYEIFLWEVGRPAGTALRVTRHSGNDQWPDLWVEP